MTIDDSMLMMEIRMRLLQNGRSSRIKTKSTSVMLVVFWALIVALASTGVSAPALAGRSRQKHSSRRASRHRRHKRPPRRIRRKARHLFRKAVRRYQVGRYEEAIALFERSWSLVPKPVILFNIASSYERLGQPEKAVDYYKRYLAVCPEDDRNNVQTKIDNIRNRPSPLKVVTLPEGARVRVNGRLWKGLTPLSGQVPPGPVVLDVSKDGYAPAHKETKAVFGKPLVLVVTLKALPKKATLVLSSKPTGAAVEVDDVMSGTTPVTITTSPGRHIIKWTMVGKKPETRIVALAPDERKKVTIRLSPAKMHTARQVDGRSGRESSNDSRGNVSRPFSPKPVVSSFRHHGLMVSAQAGYARFHFGKGLPYQPDLDSWAANLQLAYVLRVQKNFSLLLGFRLLDSSLDAASDQNATIQFLDLSGFLGLEFVSKEFDVGRGSGRFAMGGNLGIGGLVLLGVDEETFLVDRQRVLSVDSPLSSLSVWSALYVRVSLWQGLGLVATPIGIDFAPKMGAFSGFHDAMKHVLRISATAGFSYEY